MTVVYTPALSGYFISAEGNKTQGKVVYSGYQKGDMGQITSDVCQDGIICGRKWL